MNHDNLLAFIRQFFGQGNFLTIPVPMIKLMGGEPEGALFLSQLVYWSDRSIAKDGWFWKSYAEWNEEIYLSEYKIKKYTEVLVKRGVLETKLKKANGSPTVHYRVHFQKLLDWIMENSMSKKDMITVNGEEIDWSEEERERYWDSIPEKTWDKSYGKKEFEDTSKWAQRYKILDSAPDWCKRVSYLLYQHTGFEPSSKPKIWIAAVNQLWVAAKQDEEILLAGIKEGEKARKESGLTMSGPRSYMNFCKNQAALREQGQNGTEESVREVQGLKIKRRK